MRVVHLFESSTRITYLFLARSSHIFSATVKKQFPFPAPTWKTGLHWKSRRNNFDAVGGLQNLQRAICLSRQLCLPPSNLLSTVSTKKSRQS
jgi:hypothetical protein